MAAPRLIAVDWGTTRLRAFLVDASGEVIDRTGADEGIMAVPPGGFPAVLRRHVGPWLDQWSVPVAMAGMVGSRNGWVEAPYVACPAGLSDIAAGLVRMDLGDGHAALIVPGLSYRDPSGVPDVMRGEETKLAGSGVASGIVVTPGTHAKWSRLAGGRVAAFASFMTGEIYAALTEHTILGKLAVEPEDEAGFARGLAAVGRPGGLTHQAFAARTSVLLGDMPGAQVGPFLSGLLIGTEIAQGLALSLDAAEIVVVADGVLAANYQTAFAAQGQACRILAPDRTFVAGLVRILDAAGA